jgi:subtilisin family serine protease
MTVKVLDQDGDGYYSDVAAGIVYATDNGARVINLSFGGDAPSQLLQDAADYAYHKGVLLVAAAGNDGGSVKFPAACENVVAVAATDQDDLPATFLGPQVDIAAPGKDIISTWLPPYQYMSKQGTSMATPHVSGAAALLWSWRPDYTNAQIQQRLESQADDVNAAEYPGRDSYLGWGRLNLYRALGGLPPGPTLTPTPSPTVTVTPTPTSTPPLYQYRLLPIFKDYSAWWHSP